MLFYSLLARLDALFLPLIHEMQRILKAEGTDYRNYSAESKKRIASAASVAVSVKAVLDTPLLTESGELTEESAELSVEIQDRAKQLEAAKRNV